MTRPRLISRTVVDSAQVGFVPGHSILTALDIFKAAKVVAAADDAMSKSIVLLF